MRYNYREEDMKFIKFKNIKNNFVSFDGIDKKLAKNKKGLFFLDNAYGKLLLDGEKVAPVFESLNEYKSFCGLNKVYLLSDAKEAKSYYFVRDKKICSGSKSYDEFGVELFSSTQVAQEAIDYLKENIESYKNADLKIVDKENNCVCNDEEREA